MAKRLELDTLEVVAPIEGRDTYNVILRDSRSGRTKLMEAGVFTVEDPNSEPLNRVLLVVANPYKRFLVPMVARVGEGVSLEQAGVKSTKLVLPIAPSLRPD